MKTLRTTSAAVALAAVLGLGSAALYAQSADSARTGSDADPMPMMRMMGACMEMMESMGDMESMGMGGSMGMMEGAMSAMPDDPESVLRQAEDLGLSEAQIRRLEEARDEQREAREASMERMREARAEMRRSVEAARERTRDVLTPDQLDRLEETASHSMDDCPMHRGSNGEPGAETDAASDGGRNP